MRQIIREKPRRLRRGAGKEEACSLYHHLQREMTKMITKVRVRFI